MTHDECDYTYQRNITCPYCLHEREASGEDHGGLDDDMKEECSECGKNFIYTTDYDVTFCSRLAPCLNEEAPHNWRTVYEDETRKIETCSTCRKERRSVNEI